MKTYDDEQAAAKLLDAGDYDKAVSLLEAMSAKNSAYALLSLGWIYETGAVGHPEIDVAKLYYLRAIDAGSISAYFEMGRLLVRQGDEENARSIFQAGARKSNFACMARLGRMMLEGRGGPYDFDGGMQMLDEAASNGQISAQRTLLKVKENNARNIFQKILLKIRIAQLAKKGAAEILTNPYSDKVR